MKCEKCYGCGHIELYEFIVIEGDCWRCPECGSLCPTTEPDSVAKLQCSDGLANFSLLALGTRFKYKGGKTVWVKIGVDLVAEWDSKQIATKWLGQAICSATENGEEIEVRIVG
jgi:hypothetical protein